MNVPKNLFYTKEHEWVKIEGGKAAMGITDHAQSVLGDITFVELPGIDNNISQFKRCATVESVKAASDVYAPLSGKVTAVNEKITSGPDIINKSPYENGWFIAFDIADNKEKESLLTPDQYEAFLKETA